MRLTTAISLASLVALIPLRSFGDTDTTLATIDDRYDGGYKNEFPQELNLVRSYSASTQQSIAILLGLEHGQGFLHPVTIRFKDSLPPYGENGYFALQASGSGETFSQELIASVQGFVNRKDVTDKKEPDILSGFKYTLTLAMLNDLAAGDESKKLPFWLQEGLAIYASGAGPFFVRSAAENNFQIHGTSGFEEMAPDPLVTNRYRAFYFLTIDYIAKQGSLETFVRAMVGGSSPSDAVLNLLGDTWPVFQDKVREYSKDQLTQAAPKENH